MKRLFSTIPWRAVLKWTGWALLLQLFLINISAALHAYRFSRFYEDASLLTANPSSNVFAKTWRLFAGQRYPKKPLREAPYYRHDTVYLRTRNGLQIEAWYAPADSARGTVILFHGLTMNKAQVLQEAAEFRYWGYRVMLVDLRAHGNSEGRVSTIGLREAEEVKLAYDFVADKGEKTIFLWGFSMGAVGVLKAVSDHRLQPAGIILEMPFASLQSHLRGRARTIGFGGFPEKPFAFFTGFWMGVERGFNGFGFRANKFASGVDCPVLLQWGEKDHITLHGETKRVFEAIPSARKKWVIYPGAGHELLLRHNPVRWRAEVGSFLTVYTR